MKTNLEKNGYVVTIYQDLSDNDGNHHSETLLLSSFATMIAACGGGDAFVIPVCYTAMEKECKNYNSLVQIENDAKFGNIVYCGTEKAI